MIILSEYELGRKVNRYGITSNKKAFVKSCALWRYLIHIGIKESYIRSKIRNMLSAFYLDEELDNIMTSIENNVKKYEMVKNKRISIYDYELELLNNFEEYTSRILFAIIIIYKNTNNKYMKFSWKEVCDLINIYYKSTNVSDSLRLIIKSKILSADVFYDKKKKKSYIRYKVNEKIIHNTGNEILNISSYENLDIVYDYLLGKTEKSNYIFCSECEKIEFKKHGRMKYCEECAENIKRINNMKLKREKRCHH